MTKRRMATMARHFEVTLKVAYDGIWFEGVVGAIARNVKMYLSNGMLATLDGRGMTIEEPITVEVKETTAK